MARHAVQVIRMFGQLERIQYNPFTNLTQLFVQISCMYITCRPIDGWFVQLVQYMMLNYYR